MKKPKKILSVGLISFLMLFPFSSYAATFDYSYGDPSLSSSQSYIVGTNNVVLASETNYKYWKPNKGGSTLVTTTPGEITYHFDFASMGYVDPISNISLGIFMPAFHWSYSQGYNALFGSTNGIDWIALAETPPVPFADYSNIGPITGLDSLQGGNDLWLRAELYSYGPNASNGGVYTNTSQLSRYDVNRSNTTFSLSVDFEEDTGGGTVPEPSIIILMAIGLLSVRYRAAKT